MVYLFHLLQASQLLIDEDSELSEEVLLKLEHLPGRWEKVQQLACVAKQQVASLQANEIAIVRKKLGAFEIKQFQFRERFHQLDFFK